MADRNPPAPLTQPMPADANAAPPRRPRRPRLFLFALGLVFLGALTLRLLAPRPVAPPQVVAYTPRQAADAQERLDALGDQILHPPAVPPPAPETPATPPTKSPRAPSPPAAVSAPASDAVRLTLSQADLNAYLATNGRIKALLAARGVRAVQILLRPPHNVICRAAILYRGRKTNVQIAGRLLPSPDTIVRLDATQAQVGTVPLPPKAVTAQAARIASQFTGRLRGRFPLTVQDIQVVGDQLVLTGTRRAPPPATPSGAGSPGSASPGRR